MTSPRVATRTRQMDIRPKVLGAIGLSIGLVLAATGLARAEDEKIIESHGYSFLVI